MIILQEKKLAEEWEDISKKDFLTFIRSAANRKMSLFEVGPDDYWVQNAKLTYSSSGTLLLQDSAGFVVGFDAKSVRERVGRFAGARGMVFNFIAAGKELKLTVH